MAEKLDLNQTKKVVKIGKLKKEVIDLLNINLKENKNIVIWKDRVKYIEKHKSDFDTEDDWKEHVEAIPEIIENPDYVGIHPNGKSIQFIKRIKKHMLVGVRLTNKKTLDFRSSYPITEDKLQIYIESGTIKSIKEIAKVDV